MNKNFAKYFAYKHLFTKNDQNNWFKILDRTHILPLGRHTRQ